MQQLAGKTAFVTGGANGIGFALGRALAEAGMNVMLADIEQGPLAAAVARLSDSGTNVRGVICDVTDPDSVERAASETVETLGNVHILCNNAGVAGGSGIDDISLDTWRWVIDVNLMGVVYGIKSFLPLMRAHGEGGHIVNTASMAGLESGMGFSPYAASKHAVVSMSEGLARQAAPLGIGVTVVCPGFVRTEISGSARNRQSKYGPAPALDPTSYGGKLAAASARQQQAGLDPFDVARLTLDAILKNELYVFTHPEIHDAVKQRFSAIEAAMDEAAAR